MLKKLLFVSDFPPSITEDLFTELVQDGIEAVEIFPKITSEITPESPCVVALLNPPSEEILEFLRKNAGNISLYVICTSKSSKPIYKNSHFRKLISVDYNATEENIIGHARRQIGRLTRYLKKQKGL